MEVRLVRMPTREAGHYRWINANMVTEVSMYPCPEDESITELSIYFGDHYIEVKFREEERALRMVSDIAGAQVQT